MTWNHRVVKVAEGPEGKEEITYGIYEVYYDDEDKPISRTVDPATFVEDTEKELISSLSWAVMATQKPVLTDEEIGSG